MTIPHYMKTKHTLKPHPIDAHIGGKIKLQRNAVGMSQDKLAHTLNVSFQQVQKYENGTNRVSARTLLLIANKLKLPITYFYEDIKISGAEITFIEPEVTGDELRLIRNLRKIPNKASIEEMIHTLSKQ